MVRAGSILFLVFSASQTFALWFFAKSPFNDTKSCWLACKAFTDTASDFRVALATLNIPISKKEESEAIATFTGLVLQAAAVANRVLVQPEQVKSFPALSKEVMDLLNLAQQSLAGSSLSEPFSTSSFSRTKVTSVFRNGKTKYVLQTVLIQAFATGETFIKICGRRTDRRYRRDDNDTPSDTPPTKRTQNGVLSTIQSSAEGSPCAEARESPSQARIFFDDKLDDPSQSLSVINCDSMFPTNPNSITVKHVLEAIDNRTAVRQPFVATTIPTIPLGLAEKNGKCLTCYRVLVDGKNSSAESVVFLVAVNGAGGDKMFAVGQTAFSELFGGSRTQNWPTFVEANVVSVDGVNCGI